MNLIKTLVDLPCVVAEDLLVSWIWKSTFGRLDDNSTTAFRLFSERYGGDLVKSLTIECKYPELFYHYKAFLWQVIRLTECLSLDCTFTFYDDAPNDTRTLGSFPNLKCLKLDCQYLSDECLRLLFSDAGTVGGKFQNLLYLSLERTHMTAEHLTFILKLPKLAYLNFSVGIVNPYRRAYDRLDSCCITRAQCDIDEKEIIEKIIKEHGFVKGRVPRLSYVNDGLLAEDLAFAFQEINPIFEDIPSSNLCHPWRYEYEMEWTPELREWFPCDFSLVCRHFKNYHIVRESKYISDDFARELQSIKCYFIPDRISWTRDDFCFRRSYMDILN